MNNGLNLLKETTLSIFDKASETSKAMSISDMRQTWQFVESTTDERVAVVGATMNELLVYSSLDKQLMSQYIKIASKLLYNEQYTALVGCDTPNKAMLKVLGSGKKSTISGAVAIARTFYLNGEPVPTFTSVLKATTLQAQQLVAQADDSIKDDLLHWFTDSSLEVDRSTKAVKAKIAELKNPSIDVTDTVTETTETADTGTETTETAETGTKTTETVETAVKEKVGKENAHYSLTVLLSHIDSMTKVDIKAEIERILTLM